MQMKAMQIARGALIRLSLASLSIILGVALFEVLARTMWDGFQINRVYRFHPSLGWTQVPGRKHTYPASVFGEPVRTEINQLGFRDLEHPVGKPPGTKRIVLIGDSFCEAVQVNMEQTFYRILEQELSSPTDRWEVINLGVGDFGQAQEYLALQEYGWQFDPDVVMLQVYAMNDVCNNSVQMADLLMTVDDPFRPYFNVSSAGRLVPTALHPWRFLLRKNLVSFRIFEAEFAMADPNERLAKRPEDIRPLLRERGLPEAFTPLLSFLEEEHQPVGIREGWRIMDAIIAEIHAECRQRKVRFLGFLVPGADQIEHPRSAWAGLLAKHPQLPLVRDFPERRLRHFFERQGIPFVTLLETFNLHPQETFPYRGGHLTPAAHRLTATRLAEELRRLGWAAPLAK
jgi:hypothetical protein